jgi:hypothetical protein
MFCKKKKPSAGLVAWTHGGELANPGSNRTWAFTLTGAIRMKRDTNESCLYLFPSIFCKKRHTRYVHKYQVMNKRGIHVGVVLKDKVSNNCFLREYMHVLLQLKTKHMDSCK